MNILYYETIIFIFAFFIHCLVWRIRPPRKNHSVFLLNIFFGIFIASIFCKVVLLPKTADYWRLFLLHSSLTLAYIVSYSAIEVDSPSLFILLNIAKGSSCGLSKESLYGIMSNEMLVVPRITDLVNDKMVFIDKDKYRLSPKGVFIISIFILFRELLKVPKGG